MASSSTSAPELLRMYLSTARTQYMYPSYVNAASFLSIKLSGEHNYYRWKEQMMCLVESHDMLGFIDGTLQSPYHSGSSKEKADEAAIQAMYREWKKSDTLVKGWIFGSLTEDVMSIVIGLQTAHDVWNKLWITYSTPPAPTATNSNNDISTATIKEDWGEYIPLYKAIQRGEWETIQELFKDNKDALTTAKLDSDGRSALHIAISTHSNTQFVENLLNEINPKLLPTLVNNIQFTTLHSAAVVDNTVVAKMLVDKNPHLLFIGDFQNCLPIHRAIFNSQITTFLFLLGVSKDHIRLSQQDGYHSPFEGVNGAMLLSHAIFHGLLDVAYDLIKEYPDMARAMTGSFIPLRAIAKKKEAYFSGTRYNFHQRFIYSHVPIENDLDDTYKIQDIENQKTYHAKFLAKCRRSCFNYSVFRGIYVKVWKVAVLHVPYIKHLQEDKLKHNKARMILKCICEEVGKIHRGSDIFEHFGEAFNLAVLNDTPEAIREILENFPQAIWTSRDGYFVCQLAIKNRCEKVYNFFVHEVTYDKHLHKAVLDKDENSLLHLAAQLAPIEKLNLVSGAALQMQRELQWFQEVNKFVLTQHKEAKNKNQETPIMVFRKEHTELRKEGEEWMKKTADSYTITSSLIITIVFAAAITVPGGNNGDTGKAIYATKPIFIVFAISDAISLFTSTTSLLLFLSILTARYREEDFLHRLPKRLILGLAMLFLSVTSMMVAFSATLYLLFGQGKAWIMIPIATLTCLPIASFVTLQLPLLVDLISSTYGHGIFRKQSDQKIK